MFKKYLKSRDVALQINKHIAPGEKDTLKEDQEAEFVNVYTILDDIYKELSGNEQTKKGVYDHDDVKGYWNNYKKEADDQQYNAKYIHDIYKITDLKSVPPELKHLDHMHLSEKEQQGSIQAVLAADSNPDKIQSIITDRNTLRKILVSILNPELKNYQIGTTSTGMTLKLGQEIKYKGTKEEPVYLSIPSKAWDSIYNLYASKRVDSYEGRLWLTTWIFQYLKKDELIRHQIRFDGKQEFKESGLKRGSELAFRVIYQAPAVRTFGWGNVANFDKIGGFDYANFKRFRETDDRLEERTIYFVFKKFAITGDRDTEYEKQMGMVTGGKTRKRRSKATKKKNRPVKRKFTRKHRGGAYTNAQIDFEARKLIDFYHIHKFDDTNASKVVIDLSKKLKDANIYLKQKNILQKFYGNIYQKASKNIKELDNELVDKTGYFQENNEMIQVSTSESGVRDPKLNIKFKKAMFIDPIIWLKQQKESKTDTKWMDKILKVFKLSPALKDYYIQFGKIVSYLTSKDGKNPLENGGNASINKMKKQITDAIKKGTELDNIDNKIYQEENTEKSIFSLFSNHTENVHDVKTTASININQPKSTSSNIKLLIEEEKYNQGSGTVPVQTDSKPSETVTEPSSTEAPTDLPKPDDTPEVKSDLRADAPEFIPQVTKEKKED